MMANRTRTSLKRLLIVIVTALSIQLFGCGYGPQSRLESNNWIELPTLVDGVIEIRVSTPRPKDKMWLNRPQLVGSETNKLTRTFIIGYDPGRGKLSGADLVYFFGAVLRIEKEDGNDDPISFEDIIDTVYLSRPEKYGSYEIVDKVFIGKEEWLRVNFADRSAAEGVAYYKPITKSYALLISMSMFGKDSDKTKLFQQRHQDLMKAMGSVKVTVADFVK